MKQSFFIFLMMLFTVLSSFGQSQKAKLSPAIETTANVLKEMGVKYREPETEPNTIEASFDIKNYQVFMIAAMETKTLFSISWFVVPDPKTYKLSRSKLAELCDFMNSNTRMSKYVYDFPNNVIQVSFRQVVDVQNISESVIKNIYRMSRFEITNFLTIVQFVCEENMPIKEANSIARGLKYSCKGWDFYGVMKYESSELGYSMRYEKDGYIADIYIYSNGKKWKDGIGDENLNTEFENVLKALESGKVQTYSNVKLLGKKRVKINGLNFMSAQYSLTRSSRDVISYVYITAINGKLLKFRITVDASKAAEAEKQNEAFISNFIKDYK